MDIRIILIQIGNLIFNELGVFYLTTFILLTFL